MTVTVRMTGITKSYPRVVANRNATVEFHAGEVHAIVGENGAGKSTLMKILYGVVRPDHGETTVRGQRITNSSPAESIRAGIGMVFQHFMLVPPLTVAENAVLGAEPMRGGLFDRERAEREIAGLSQKYGLPIDPRMRVEDCSVGLQQRVEILKVLLRGAEVIILDEPTAVLTPQEVDELIAVMRRLAAAGKTVILITHKLREVMAASDRVTIMRHGETIETLETKKTTAAEIAHKMIGRELKAPPRTASARGEAVLEVRGLVAEGVRDVDLTVRRGEIVGVAGIEGNGQSELVECIAGLRRVESGSIRCGELAHIPEDRHKRGVILDFTLEENAILGVQRRRFRERRAHTEAILTACDVRPPVATARMRDLSGGNQQKLVIGRELAKKADVLLACHPTRGLDIGASEFVRDALLAERARGAGVLFVSAELSELMAISDRIVVLSGGRIAGEVDPAKVDERKLGLMMAGHA